MMTNITNGLASSIREFLRDENDLLPSASQDYPAGGALLPV
jgi:hypothetical protein